MQELAAAARTAARLEGTGEDDPGPPLVPAVREKIIAYFDASRAWAGQCAFSTEPGSVRNILRMKTLGIETFLLRSQKAKIFGKNQPLEKILLKNNLCKKRGDFLDHC
jgi:hypothetical protein